jgi:hypothetical protein
VSLTCTLKNGEDGWALVLSPIIPAMQEAEIRQIKVRNQPRANSWRDPILINPSLKKDW